MVGLFSRATRLSVVKFYQVNSQILATEIRNEFTTGTPNVICVLNINSTYLIVSSYLSARHYNNPADIHSLIRNYLIERKGFHDATVQVILGSDKFLHAEVLALNWAIDSQLIQQGGHYDLGVSSPPCAIRKDSCANYLHAQGYNFSVYFSPTTQSDRTEQSTSMWSGAKSIGIGPAPAV